MVKDQLILPQNQGSLNTIDLNTFETVKKFVPDETGERVGNPMCLEYFQVKGTEYLLVGYDSGQSLLKLLDNQLETTNAQFCR